MTRKSYKAKKNTTAETVSNSGFEQTYLDCYESLKSVIARYLRRPEDVEDIVQETFVRTYEARQKSQILNFKAYFFMTARNLSLKHKALHVNKFTDYLGDLGISEVYDERAPIESAYETHEEFGLFCEAVRDLPRQSRRVLILKKVYGLSHEEIAKRLNITVSTTNQHLAKAIARCTIYMQDRGYLDKEDCRSRDSKADAKS